jgi:hypothetical protein
VVPTFFAAEIFSMRRLSGLVEPNAAAVLHFSAGQHLTIGAGVAASRNGEVIFRQIKAVLVAADD